MKKNLLIYLTIILFISLSFGVWYYIYHISNQKIIIKEPMQQPIEEPIEQPISNLPIQLRAGSDEHRLDGSIISIDTTKNPAEITFVVLWDSNRFINIPSENTLQRTITVDATTQFWQGAFMSTEINPIQLTDLKPGDNIIIGTTEPILDLLTRETYHASFIRRVIKN